MYVPSALDPLSWVESERRRHRRQLKYSEKKGEAGMFLSIKERLEAGKVSDHHELQRDPLFCPHIDS